MTGTVKQEVMTVPTGPLLLVTSLGHHLALISM